MRGEGGTLLTLEPLIESVRDGVQTVRWELSGLQKTTSHQFEGKWEGDWTRSAYLFFHAPGSDAASVEAYLDETSRGLKGNLALVLDGRDLGVTGEVAAVLEGLAGVARRHLPEGYRSPVSVRYRLPDGKSSTPDTTVEIRFKLRIPPTAIEAGAAAVSALASTVVHAFEAILDDEVLTEYAVLE